MYSPCTLALDLAVALRGSLTCPLSCLKGSCHHEVPFALRFADEPSHLPLRLKADLVLGGKHQALLHTVWVTLLLCPAWAPTGFAR